MSAAVVQYREFAPCPALHPYITAFFSFAPPIEEPHPRLMTREVVFGEGDSFCSPLFADAQVSMVFSFDRACCLGGGWRSGSSPRGDVIGAMTAVGETSLEERPEMIGAYFRPGRSTAFTGVPASELTDRVVPVGDLPPRGLHALAAELIAMGNGTPRINCLESALLKRLPRSRLYQANTLVEYVLRARGRLRVERLAETAGVSRQHLTRTFRESVGITPKLYGRLARFHTGLRFAGCEKKPDWAQVALELGYADQSHMIAEFREFSSLTPERLVSQRWFHPFIERAR